MVRLMQIGQFVLGRYEIIDLISEGGQASIAKAQDKNTNSIIVVKHLIAYPGQSNYDEELSRFQRAAQIRIGHPNVVDPIDYGEEDGEHYMIMPFIEGITLENHLISHGGKLSVDQAVSIIAEVASGLGAIHRKSIVHRDMKPLNIIMGTDGHPYIIDLGICRKANEQTITKGPGLIGSLQWLSPEQVANPGTEDHRSDLYSLAAIFYFMLTGSTPVQGTDPGSIVLSICQHIPPSPRQLNPLVPEHIDQACMRLLAKQPEARFQTAEEFIQAINSTAQTPGAGCFCTSCGSEIQPGSRYCPNCGALVNSDQNQPAWCFACGTQVGEAAVCANCGRPFSHSDHRLSFSTGTLTGMSFRIPEGIFSVGRDELSPRDYHISRQHLSVACLNGTVLVQDAGSANKTYIAGRLADHPIPLTPNQELCIAGNTATYNHN